MENFKEQAQRVYNFIGTLSKEHPKVAEGFMALNKGAEADNVLSKKVKELLALSIAIAIRCEGCIACHVKAALEAGATQEEIVETIGVTISMGGGPSIVYGEKAYQAMKEMM
ncbi:MAG: carboxymuconolactone decarboxylase family protein [Bacteroidales bacterium]|jgi:AhpD family alkylhydroperoxidase|nr:carboxymuconolactone decarboxylase family protein [Bacteroidales bacterium]MDD2350810.1 carboxymuconolactone decarboxylase family protein [Synergistaceae bacterium]MDD2812948.1 carboxymuconolactone decarboxylase family protein [Bacteroidales bacterium]MDD3385928.1 carboxymuconolactone decarboxylase family protein [Bacteroidales bacterium]MDD3812110.1 carboxymuconolactone decarboxylase family protein [Bacteroidales bacterium]